MELQDETQVYCGCRMMFSVPCLDCQLHDPSRGAVFFCKTGKAILKDSGGGMKKILI